MKRILLPAGGAVLATGLLAAGLAGTAQADAKITDEVLASQAKAAEILDFWTKSNNAALKQASAYHWDSKDVTKVVSKGGYSPDGKPGSTAPIGEEKKSAVKTQNVNLPKTIGKVFFEGRDGNLYWCSGTSIQSNYRNLVATAGHCVYDVSGNAEVVSRWVFVPGYYEGKTPYGVYVGKQAFTHYDFDVYEDFDRDYAFVTVYNGIGGTLNKPKQVTKAEFEAYKGDKDVKQTQVSFDEYKKGRLDPKTTEYYSVDPGSRAQKVGPDYPGAVVEKKEVSKRDWWRAPVGKANGAKYGEPETVSVTKREYEAYRGPGEKAVDRAGNYTITRYYVQQWYKPGTEFKFLRTDYYIIVHEVKDAGRLGDVVGGQGFAWNQPTGKYVRTFGYPYGKHPDGSKPYTGKTPKWCYGKTGAKTTQAAKYKVEEHVSLKCAVTGGYDGGPWLFKYSNAKRLGYVNGVTSLLYDADGNDRWDHISSPYFDGETAAVYNAAKNVWSGQITPMPK
ncbi:serine protease [Nonomuraea sp. C10]|uniref:trypsin-like serine peptidase n=1 Tax=Nonomuraea sp. C10 TaxID=2600577 RepID=UPI0011CEA36F|nr:hypothetical protein [Nonomuraea sp. C10]TXK38537.1 hypothetical protein FR742_02235 [Nonomuraea sp. C10]